ncbi:MAG: ATP-binding protein [Spirochaetia bacterium]|jgi:nitrogen fixation/metabolism regulation signal transduction histidine kinase|nr:ATP-binding protein [Spirochaetia bacterium]
MKGPQPLITSRAGLLSILFIYVFIIFLILFLSGQIMNDLSTEDVPSRLVILPFAAVLPFFLIANIAINVVKIIRDNRKKKPGVTFKIKLILFFTFVAFVSAVPQAILSINFIDTVMKSWLTRDHSGSVKGGLDIALEYYRERTASLEAVVDSPFFSYAARAIPSDPAKGWELFKESYPFLDSMQLIRGGETLFFTGREKGKLPDEEISPGGKGLLTRETADDVSILRVKGSFRGSGGSYTLVFSSFLPSGFDSKAEKLTSSYDVLVQLENYQTVFRLIIIAVLMFFSLPIFLLSIMISFRLSEEILHPIVQLEEATRRVAEGDFSFRLLARPGDNISVLVRSFNQMIKELEVSRKKNMQADKINAWKEIAKRMAHEIKNPLTPIKLSAERTLKRYNSQDPNFSKILNSSVRVIVTEVERLSRLLAEFSDFARMPPVMLTPSDPAEIIREVCDIFTSSSPGIVFNLQSVDAGAHVRIDREKIKQVLINLFTNAIDAMDSSGTVSIRTDTIVKENRKFYRIQIADSGKGIAGEIADQVFAPYFTTRENGTGLGLAIVERIIFDHNGSIWFETEKGVGSTFFIDLPFGTEND